MLVVLLEPWEVIREYPGCEALAYNLLLLDQELIQEITILNVGLHPPPTVYLRKQSGLMKDRTLVLCHMLFTLTCFHWSHASISLQTTN